MTAPWDFYTSTGRLASRFEQDEKYIVTSAVDGVGLRLRNGGKVGHGLPAGRSDSSGSMAV